MTFEQVKRCRERQIELLAERGDGDLERAKRLYSRCVRFCLRYFRWGEIGANGPSHYTKWMWDMHEHEGELIKNLCNRLNDELSEYGLEWEFPGLFPILKDKSGNNPIELFWYRR